MGRPAGQSKFCWVLGFRSDDPTRRYFEPDEHGHWKCTMPTERGECKYVVPTGKSGQVSNLASHLRSHRVNEGPNPKLRQPTLDGFKVMPDLSSHDKWSVIFACNGWSWSSAENPDVKSLLKELTIGLPDRKVLSAQTKLLAPRLRASVLSRLGPAVTLCYDSGTVHNTYLVFVAASADQHVIVRSFRKDDKLFKGEGFTAANITLAINDVRELIEKHGGNVVTYVADNASNMQGTDYITQRCAAHVLQLTMKDCGRVAVVADALELLDQLDPDIKKLLPRTPETRWGYNVRRLEHSVMYYSSMPDRNKVEQAIALLKPFQEATDLVQGHGATMFSCMAMWESLLRSCSEPQAHELASQRFQYMLRDAYVIIAYFSPTVNQLEFAPHIGCGRGSSSQLPRQVYLRAHQALRSHCCETSPFW
jgi:hypothetical protein